MLRFSILTLCLIWAGSCFAQPVYNQSAGIRLGHTSALTFKKFFGNEEALEVLLSGRREGIQVSALYIFHQPMQFSFNENFYAYYGLGAHMGYERYGGLSKTLISVDPPQFLFDEQSYFVMGFNGILGLEYRWLSVPVTLGFDLKPYYNFVGMRYTRTRFWDSAISIKYVF